MRHSGSGMGVDLIMVIGAVTLYTEESWCSHDYSYRQAWWNKCRVQRFNQYVSDKHHIHVVLTNRPQNFRGVSTGVIRLLSISQLLGLVHSLLSDTTNRNRYTTTLNTNRCIGMVEGDSDRAILAMLKEVVRPRWIDERLKQLEKQGQ